MRGIWKIENAGLKHLSLEAWGLRNLSGTQPSTIDASLFVSVVSRSPDTVPGWGEVIDRKERVQRRPDNRQVGCPPLVTHSLTPFTPSIRSLSSIAARRRRGRSVVAVAGATVVVGGTCGWKNGRSAYGRFWGRYCVESPERRGKNEKSEERCSRNRS